jgi:phosphatidate cytidylyltransferase
MKKRILTGLVLAPLALYVVGWSPPWLFLLVLLAFVERGLYEYSLISRQAGFETVPVVGYVAAGALCVAQAAEIFWPATQRIAFSATLVLSVLLTLAVALWRPSEPRKYLSAAASTIFGIIYIGFMLSWLVPLRFSGYGEGPQLTVLMFVVVCSSDIFAYFVGRSVGRTPLFPRISPKKTVEGSLAGFGGSLVVGWGFAHWFWQTAPLKRVILLSAVVAIAGQVGDLVESALKRAGEVKDSGTLLPGHGGVLDRIDSLIFAAPAMWAAVALAAMQRLPH